MKNARILSSTLLIGAGLLMVGQRAQADPADLDTTFDSDGKVTTAFLSPITNYAHTAAMKIQSDGKIVTVGEFDGNWAITRHTSAGVLDTSFSSNGKVSLNLGDTDAATAVDIQSDGKIVVAGYRQTSTTSYLYAARFLTNGTLDTTFNTNGRVSYNFGTSCRAYGVKIQSDGKIVVAGNYYSSTQGDNFLVARLQSNGSLDTSFSSDGRVDVDLGGFESATAVELQSDGKIVAVGTIQTSGTPTVYDMAVIRLNSDGSLDTAFDSDGKLTVNVSGDDSAEAVAIQSNGKIVVVGSATPSSTPDFAAIRLNSNGSLDTTFNSDGKVTTHFSGADYAKGVALQSDGKIVLAGYTGSFDFALARYSTNGTLDTGFSGDGKATTDFLSSSVDRAYAIAIQSDGKIVVAGDTIANSIGNTVGGDIALARYLGTYTPPSPIIAPKTPKGSSTSAS